jgi:hypothetical protein
MLMYYYDFGTIKREKKITLPVHYKYNAVKDISDAMEEKEEKNTGTSLALLPRRRGASTTRPVSASI